MKKMIFAACVAAVVAMTSCTSQATKGEDEGAALKAKIENCTNPDSLKIYVDQANKYAAKLIAEGRDVEAKAYIDEVTPVVEKKDPTLVEVLKADAKEVAEATADAVDATTDAAKEKAGEAVDAAKEKAGEAVDAAKDKAGAAVDAAKDKAKDAADKATDAASSAVNGAADKLKGLGK